MITIVLVGNLILGACAAPALAPVPDLVPAPAPAPPAPALAPASALTLASVPAPAPALAPKLIQLHFSSAHTPKSAIHYAVWVRFANELKKRTDGRVTVTIYHSNSLLSTREAYDGIISGVADMAYVIPDHTPGRFPLFEVTSLPFMVPSSEVGTRLGDALLENIPEMMAEFKAVHMLWTWKTEAFGLSLTEKAGPVRTLEDIKGKKIGGGAMTIALLKALGAAPLSVGISDRYLSAQTGVIDGLLMGWAGLTGWSLYEVTKYHTDANLLAGGAVMVMNKDFWNSLPSDIQKIISPHIN